MAIAALATILAIVPLAWAAAGLAYQAPGGPWVRALAAAVWIAFSAAALLAAWRGHATAALPPLAAAFAIFCLWWQSIAPSNDRHWADDVERIVHADIDGNAVIVHDVRNFEWRAANAYTPHWEVRSYDLDRLRSADMILSYWQGPAIAHVLVSFGFDDGRYVTFSVEVRRERNETFSEIGGFFKQFELAIIAADERDIVFLRTNVRGEDDHLYRLKLPRAAIRSLFVAYLDEAARLRETPRFYNALTVNCTTLVHHMMERIVGRLPWSYRLLLSGYLPGYVYAEGGLDDAFTLDELRDGGRITARAIAAGRSESFSSDIRRGVPGIEP